MTTEELRAQVALQCRAVAHMADVLSKVNADYSMLMTEGHMDNLIQIVGKRSAHLMEFLGEALNGIDAVEDEDEWMDPVFEKAQELWPVESSDA